MSERGFQFPCEIPIKAMGAAEEDFAAVVSALIGRHVTVEATAVRSRPSTRGNYQSVTVTVTLESREQLEAIYADLQASERVLWTL